MKKNRQTDLPTVTAQLLAALEEAVAEIEYCYAEMLSEKERRHPRGSGWARVHDKATAAIALAKAQARANRDIDIHAVLAERHQIAVIWGIKDMLRVRPSPFPRTSLGGTPAGRGKPRPCVGHPLDNVPNRRR